METLPEQWTTDYIGCRGINGRLLLRDVKPRTEAFGPDNVLSLVRDLLTAPRWAWVASLSLASRRGEHWPREAVADFSGQNCDGQALIISLFEG